MCQQLVTKGTRDAYVANIKAENEHRREQHRNKGAKAPQLSLPQARAKKFKVDWAAYTPPVPTFLGVKALDDYPLAELVPYIDWMPFFNAWEFAGKFPDILKDAVVGEAASSLYADATRMLDQLIEQQWLKARAVVGFFPANSVGDDDINVFADEARGHVELRLHNLRQQKSKPQDQAQLCLSDFIAPAATGRADYIGAFAVTAGIGVAELVARFERDHDDYNSIMTKALADRLAEALA